MTTPKKDATPAQSGARTDGPHDERAPKATENAGKPRKAHSRAFYNEARRHAVRSDDAHAFVPDPAEHKAPVDDDLAEELAENYLMSATTGEEVGQAEEKLIQALIDRFKHHRNLIWLVGEEALEAYPVERVRAIAVGGHRGGRCQGRADERHQGDHRGRRPGESGVRHEFSDSERERERRANGSP